MLLSETLKNSFALKSEKEKLEAEIDERKLRIAEIEKELAPINESILTDLKLLDKQEIELDGLFANWFKKENVGYTSDADVIKYLKENGFEKFVKVKTTESLDKTPLKKELKTNESLSKALEAFIVKSLTEYVVVTNAENHAKMLEHINENTK